ncbi:vacuolar protein sorting-associated protein 53 homolog [Condylostylus longicornis]|uniref:vacuolar protein sorting-associated protein 53 homolog n=1 Tax=Condylostylus longicornis TaxID=2530218 RepID=UPI00244E0A4B|nr:vacuolar protein sorting-associated protein 53 homolog [Condylostylus longicornis]
MAYQVNQGNSRENSIENDDKQIQRLLQLAEGVDDLNIEDLQSRRIIFSNNVQTAIDQVLQSNDPLDSPDFNAVDYINQLFPNEQSLSNIDEVISKMECEVTVIDDNIRSVVRGQTNVSQDGRLALDEAQKTINQMCLQISDIQNRAEQTEEMVKEITRDIKQLDCAKRNLTTAITTLNHLHMLVGGVESLNKLIEKRLYGEILNPLQAIIEVNNHFQQYCNVSQIKDLSNTVNQIQRTLSAEITEDFHSYFGPNVTSPKIPLAQLSDACKVVSVLDPKVKKDLLKWFLNLQLEEYIQLFHENQDIAWLDKIDKRYAWLKRHLLDFEGKFGTIFPIDWEVSERITVQFCNITKDELSKIMSKRRNEIDVKLLLFAMTKTQSFEQLLAKRFTGTTLIENDQQKNVKEENISSNKDYELNNGFTDIIGVCFKSHLDIYTESIDRNLTELLDRFVEQANEYFDPIAAGSTVFSSCADLFVFYKKCMVQCSHLSNSKPMYDLAMIFKKYLREYASKVLESNIPKSTSTQSALGGTMSFRDLQNLSTAAGQVIHNFLKEGESHRLAKDELIRICCVLTTSEYCLETVQQLEDKLKEKIDNFYIDKIDLSEEQDIYHRIISTCIQLMVQDLENGCEPALTIMSKIQWQNITNVGDQSSFVNSMNQNFKQTIPIIRDNLSSSRKYYTQFCHKFINQFIPKFLNNIYKCKLTNSEGQNNILGCEQLLLDTHSLKTILLDLPSIGSQINRKAPTSYTKVVIKGMTHAEMIIKTVMTPIQPHTNFNNQILKLLPEITVQEYQKILDMKGLKRTDQLNLIEIFKKAMPEIKENNVIASSSSSITASDVSSNNNNNSNININNSTNDIIFDNNENDLNYKSISTNFDNTNKTGINLNENHKSKFASILSGGISGVQQISSAVGHAVVTASSNSTSQNMANSSNQNDRGRIKKLEKLIKKRLPN